MFRTYKDINFTENGPFTNLEINIFQTHWSSSGFIDLPATAVPIMKGAEWSTVLIKDKHQFCCVVAERGKKAVKTIVESRKTSAQMKPSAAEG